MKRLLNTILGVLAAAAALQAADSTGTVYIVCGSDAAIWDGLNIGVYDGRLYDGDVYSSPEGNGFAVMDTSFRLNLRDSDGTPLKMTWWMMAGNVFHLSRNCDVPVRNNVTLHLMKKYHQAAIDLYDDVLTLHYHNYHWSDTDGDGRFYYNQGLDFRLNQADFEECCMKYLIEDHVFPVSFRSGWHYMDNYYQAYMDRFIPFQMGSAYPSKGGDYEEPTNNIIDWSLSPAKYSPWHPSPENYQLEGDCPGWQLRSVYYTGLWYTYKCMDECFSQAAEGKDQMVCLWSHIPEDVFVSNLDSVNRYAHELAAKYDVRFKYCGDAEAMRLWMGSEDTIPPLLTIEEIPASDGLKFRISSDEPIFQKAEPFVACKTVYETYERLDCSITGENTWETEKAVAEDILAKVAVSACDTLGNQSNVYLDYIHNDIYIDDGDSSRIAFEGSWQPVVDNDNVYWDLTAQQTEGANAFVCTPEILETRQYALYMHAPKSTADSLICVVNNGSVSDTARFEERLQGSNSWQHLGFYDLTAGSGNTIRVQNLSDDTVLGLDVLRITPLVPQKKLTLNTVEIQCGEVSVQDSSRQTLVLSNEGVDPVTISSIEHFGSNLTIDRTAPLLIPSMSSDTLDLVFYSNNFMNYNDVIVIRSDDKLEPVKLVHFQADASSFFKRVDNDDPENYSEYGSWATSCVQAWGTSSRYASLVKGTYADFETIPAYSGTYDLQFIVPKTVNATDHASYILIVDGTPVDTVVVNQNTDSGNFVSLGEYELSEDVPVRLRVAYLGGNTISGSVLRADAVKFLLTDEHPVEVGNFPEIPLEFHVYNAYPNPFNPSCSIDFDLPEDDFVQVDIFDLSGRKITTLCGQNISAGHHRLVWRPETSASGTYLYRVAAGSNISVKRCTYIK